MEYVSDAVQGGWYARSREYPARLEEAFAQLGHNISLRYRSLRKSPVFLELIIGPSVN